MNEKHFTLVSGYEDGYQWRIQTQILRNGTFHTKGYIQIQNAKESSTKFRAINGNKNREQNRKSYHKHRLEYREKRIIQRHKRRELDFNPLNEYFEGSHAHHMDKETVIYIPRKLHQSIRHSLLKNQNMCKINAAAWEFLKEQSIC